MTKSTTVAKAPKAAAVAKTPKAKTVKAVSVAPVDAKTFCMSFIEALTARNTEQYSKDTETALNNAKRSNASLDAVAAKPCFAEIKHSILKNVRISDAKQNKQDFVAVKVLVKMVAALNAIGQGLTSQLDPYTRTIVANMIALNSLSNKSALVSLSKSISYDETEQVAALVKRYNCSANTAGTQASSTRMMLKQLDICEIAKGKQGDVMTFKDNDRARAFVSLFA